MSEHDSEHMIALLRNAVRDLRAFTTAVRSGQRKKWTKQDWNDMFRELLELDQVYEDVLRSFGRTYLSVLTGKRITSAKKAAIAYLLLKLGTPVSKQELRVIAGIGEWARRVRELRVEEGWPIAAAPGIQSEYYLSDVRPDPAVKKSWQEVHEIRRSPGTPGDRMLTLMRNHIGAPVLAEQLSYVANTPNWKEHLLGLRTETGLRISGHYDRPDLEDAYLLESDYPLPDEDEWQIPAELRGQVLEADGRTCTACGWQQDSTADRWLEVHRRSPGNDLKDFAALCNVCHERFHVEGPGAVRIKLNRYNPVRAEDWHGFFDKRISGDISLEDAGKVIHRMLLPAVRVAGQWLPHIREINWLRENTLWQERVGRVATVLEKRFGPVWFDIVGEALRPPLNGKPGDGFEQLVKYLIQVICRRQAETNVSLEKLFPGKTFRDAKEIDVYVPAHRKADRAFLSLKWSLRGDRSQQPQLEARSFAALQPDLFFAVLTNEYDVSRLRPLLDDPNIKAVYHVDRSGIEAMWRPEPDGLKQLEGLMDITDLLRNIRSGGVE